MKGERGQMKGSTNFPYFQAGDTFFLVILRVNILDILRAGESSFLSNSRLSPKD